ncbi:hypothetical protein B0H17DRAFT_1115154 [Mycena rosella]|uniref:MYND-type domain-containing protein n=1 Tax=Mycena rosella TaxID=1033263 RepID=A0AAD7BCL5_MYCRO|nr:hypothetical protein B0H17DRAFT_1115154 [Mycena rosella]
MHPDLRPGNISTLPISYKRYASPALNGSLTDFQKLMDFLKKRPHSDPALFLPVYYSNLDPAGIPTAAQLDSWTDHVSPINRALLALQGTTQLWAAGFRWPDGVLSLLWPRIWKWINWLDTYRETVQGIIPLSEVDAYSLYMRSIIEILTNSTAVPLANMPPGIRVFGGRAWRITLPPTPGRNTVAHSDVVRFLGNDTNSGQPSNFREYLEGVGTVDDFAALVLRHIAHAMPQPTPLYLFFQLSGMLGMLVERNDHGGPLHRALLDHGIIKAVTNVACHYATSSSEETVEIVAMCFTLLLRAFDAFPSYTAVAEALESNKLIALITTCAQREGIHWNQSLRRLLETVLPPSVWSYSVLKALSGLLTDRQRLVPANGDRLFPALDFQDVELSTMWEQFNKLATQRVSTFQAYDIGAYQSIRGCDNMDCGRLCRRNEIKRCSSCRQTNYCSVKCQSLDWRVHGHRHICARLRPLLLAPEHTLSSVRDSSFVHALVHHDYELHILTWCTHKIYFMYAHPGVPFYLMWDYIRGTAALGVRACAEAPPDPEPSDASAA